MIIKIFFKNNKGLILETQEVVLSNSSTSTSEHFLSCYKGTICSSFGQTSGAVHSSQCSSSTDTYCKSYSGTISGITAIVYSCAQTCTDGRGVIDGVMVSFKCCQSDNCNYNRDMLSSLLENVVNDGHNEISHINDVNIDDDDIDDEDGDELLSSFKNNAKICFKSYSCFYFLVVYFLVISSFIFS